ncbi:MAG: hypothetical protein WCR67_02355 [Bacilli bacterium]
MIDEKVLNSEFGIKKAGAGNLTGSIGIDDQLKETFLAQTKERLSHNILAKKQVSPLLLTKKTFENSLGDIYLFLNDVDYCRDCKGSLKNCLKRTPGYFQDPFYDSDIDQIMFRLVPCKYLRRKNQVISLIVPSGGMGTYIYDKAYAFFNYINDEANRKRLMDSTIAVRDIINLSRNFKTADNNTGLSFFSFNDHSHSETVLTFACFAFANKGFSSGYINLSETFDLLSSKDYDERQIGINRIEKAKNCQSLCFENFDLLQKKYGKQLFIEYLLPLLESRTGNGKINFFSMTQDKSPEAYVHYLFYGLDQMSLAQDYAKKLSKNFVIKDLSL